MDEVFGEGNFVAQIIFRKTSGKASDSVDVTVDFLLYYARNIEQLKIRPSYEARDIFSDQNMRMVQLQDGSRRSLDRTEAEGTRQLPAQGHGFSEMAR
jgi:adenine-specific DNA-methyltransferase